MRKSLVSLERLCKRSSPPIRQLPCLRLGSTRTRRVVVVRAAGRQVCAKSSAERRLAIARRSLARSLSRSIGRSVVECSLQLPLLDEVELLGGSGRFQVAARRDVCGSS